MLIRITEYQKIDTGKLMDVYSESNYENTDYFFPDEADKEAAVHKVEAGFSDYRRKGYGAILLSGVADSLKEYGPFRLCCCVSKKNTASLKAYEKSGFQIVSEEGYDYLNGEADNHDFGLEGNTIQLLSSGHRFFPSPCFLPLKCAGHDL